MMGVLAPCLSFGLLLSTPALAGHCADAQGMYCAENDSIAVQLISEVESTDAARSSHEALASRAYTHRVFFAAVRPERMHAMTVQFDVVAHYSDGSTAVADPWLLTAGDEVQAISVPFIIDSHSTEVAPSGKSYLLALCFPKSERQIVGISLEALR